ncbi:MAG: ribonuclease P protein component [Syntrophobacterales bacterium]|nr:ribonuclease P protein component [Syntrophobacterales bacterium]
MNTFKPYERLRNSRSYELVKSRGKRIKGRFFIINYMPNGLSVSRLGLIVPKKYYKKAVERNRVKRCVREWFRLHKDLLSSPPKDIVVVVLPGMNLKSCRGTFEELESLCGRIY